MTQRGSQRVRDAAFTIVELLVVIAIIGLLVALVLPAVQSARESSRQSSCLNNLRQWGIAMQQHESSYGRFPPGGLSPTYANRPQDLDEQKDRRTVVVSLWPFLDAQTVLGSYDLLQPFWATANRTAVGAQVPVYYCPSDRPGAMSRLSSSNTPMARGNYVCNWGNNGFRYDGLPNGSSPRLKSQPGPFRNYEREVWGKLISDIESRRQYGRAAGAFLDGLSNTIFMSEIRVAPRDTDNDSRGNILDNIACGPTFMTRAVPNVASPPYDKDPPPYKISPAGREDVDHCYCPMSPAPTDPATCETNQSDSSLGITAVSPGWPDGWNAARSRHPGGVGVLLGDGATRFVSNAITLVVWQQYGTIASSELVEQLP